MKLLTALLLLGCSGPAFTSEELINEQGNNTPVVSGGSGEAGLSGGGGSTEGLVMGGGGNRLEGAGGSAGTLSGGPSQAGSSGASALAGRPPMGEGGDAGASGTPDLRSCLAGYQSLECAKVCTNSDSDCQAVLNCYVTTNSLDNCSNFTSVGISLAGSAERMCCNG